MKTIPVFYSPKQSLDRAIGISPSPMKPRLLAEYWSKLNKPVQLKKVSPVTKDIYYLAHDQKYVDEVLGCKVPNGFGTFDKELVKTLPYLTGSVIQAGESVLSGESPIAYSLSSGSHHARHSVGGGFCTFNHNTVAAIHLKHKFKLKRVGLKCGDAHFSDGDFDIKRKLNLDWLQVYSFGEENISPSNADEWLNNFHQTCLSFEGCDLVIFNAGVDAFLDCPLGGILTADQMRRRDAIVLETMKLLNIPCVITLAGAYGDLKSILDLHTQTLDEAQRVFLKQSA